MIGFSGESNVKMLNPSILKRVLELSKGPAPVLKSKNGKKRGRGGDENDEGVRKKLKGKELKNKRQTFIFSATLTLAAAEGDKKRDFKGKNVKKLARADKELKIIQDEFAEKNGLPKGILAEILRKAGSTGKVKIVDLTSSSAFPPPPPSGKGDTTSEPTKSVINLPEGLSLLQARCATLHKDSHLFAYLSTTAQGTSGPSIVFCNSIAGCRRVGETMEMLGLPVKVLHAQLQQVRNGAP